MKALPSQDSFLLVEMKAGLTSHGGNVGRGDLGEISRLLDPPTRWLMYCLGAWVPSLLITEFGEEHPS
jgi:hypothetical protein